MISENSFDSQRKLLMSEMLGAIRNKIIPKIKDKGIKIYEHKKGTSTIAYYLDQWGEVTVYGITNGVVPAEEDMSVLKNTLRLDRISLTGFGNYVGRKKVEEAYNQIVLEK